MPPTDAVTGLGFYSSTRISPHLPERNYAFTHFWFYYWKGTSVSGLYFFLFCVHTVHLRICFYPTWKLVLTNKYGPHLSLPLSVTSFC